MSLLITLAIIGGVVGLYAVACFGVYASVYIVSLIKTFNYRVEKLVEAIKVKHEAKKVAKEDKKELETELKDAEKDLSVESVSETKEPVTDEVKEEK